MHKKKIDKEFNFTRWINPLVKALIELGGTGKPKEVFSKIAVNENLSDKILDELTETGVNKFQNQVRWARQYLVWSGFIDGSQRGLWKIRLSEGKSSFSNEEIKQIVNETQRLFYRVEGKEISTEDTPAESSEALLDSSASLLDVLRKLTPKGFENISRELLRAHGFENVEVTGAPNDGGFDGFGILKINPLVSFRVLFQCKRYQGSVGRSQIGDFRNSMLGRAEMGIILTTGTFTSEAVKEAERVTPKVELIDGEQLIDMFEKVRLGLKEKIVYEVDINYFRPFMSDLT